jgi:hypothetical protein
MVPPAIAAVLCPGVAEDRSEPKLAVTNEGKLDSVRVEVSVEVVWKVLVDVGSVCTFAVALMMVVWKVLADVGSVCTAAIALMVDVGVACNAAALELAAEGM